MEGISDLKITGMDPARPPAIQSIPCIELAFALSHQASKDWCDEFNLLMSKQPYSTRIDPETGLFIETWVRQPEEIVRALARMKQGVEDCIRVYIDRVEAERKARAAKHRTEVAAVSEAQKTLDRVVAQLIFDEPVASR